MNKLPGEQHPFFLHEAASSSAIKLPESFLAYSRSKDIRDSHEVIFKPFGRFSVDSKGIYNTRLFAAPAIKYGDAHYIPFSIAVTASNQKQSGSSKQWRICIFPDGPSKISDVSTALKSPSEPHQHTLDHLSFDLDILQSRIEVSRHFTSPRTQNEKTFHSQSGKWSISFPEKEARDALSSHLFGAKYTPFPSIIEIDAGRARDFVKGQPFKSEAYQLKLQEIIKSFLDGFEKSQASRLTERISNPPSEHFPGYRIFSLSDLDSHIDLAVENHLENILLKHKGDYSSKYPDRPNRDHILLFVESFSQIHLSVSSAGGGEPSEYSQFSYNSNQCSNHILTHVQFSSQDTVFKVPFDGFELDFISRCSSRLVIFDAHDCDDDYEQLLKYFSGIDDFHSPGVNFLSPGEGEPLGLG